MRIATKLTFRSLLLSIAAAVVVPTSAYSSLFEIPASSLTQEPYVLCGRVESRLGGETVVASGGLATSNVVLTAADAVWNEEDGFATRVLFQRARRGSNIRQTSRATFIVLLARFTTSTDSNVKVGTNVAGLLFRTRVANGRHLHLVATRDSLVVDTHNFIVGYADSIGNGNRMVTYSGPTFTRVAPNIYAPHKPSKVSPLTKGGPVFHFGSSSSTTSSFDYVGVVVAPGFVRGFTQREISEITGFGG